LSLKNIISTTSSYYIPNNTEAWNNLYHENIQNEISAPQNAVNKLLNRIYLCKLLYCNITIFHTENRNSFSLTIIGKFPWKLSSMYDFLCGKQRTYPYILERERCQTNANSTNVRKRHVKTRATTMKSDEINVLIREYQL
jgi:hypothetical protein